MSQSAQSKVNKKRDGIKQADNQEILPNQIWKKKNTQFFSLIWDLKKGQMTRWVPPPFFFRTDDNMRNDPRANISTSNIILNPLSPYDASIIYSTQVLQPLQWDIQMDPHFLLNFKCFIRAHMPTSDWVPSN